MNAAEPEKSAAGRAFDGKKLFVVPYMHGDWAVVSYARMARAPICCGA